MPKQQFGFQQLAKKALRMPFYMLFFFSYVHVLFQSGILQQMSFAGLSTAFTA